MKLFPVELEIIITVLCKDSAPLVLLSLDVSSPCPSKRKSYFTFFLRSGRGCGPRLAVNFAFRKLFYLSPPTGSPLTPSGSVSEGPPSAYPSFLSHRHGICTAEENVS